MICSFRGEYEFLSNMYYATIILGGVTYSCAEAAFQAVKLEDKTKRKMFSGLSGTEAKKLGRQVQLRKNWNSIRVDVMRWIIHEKFKQHPELAEQLRNTAGHKIVEGNTWNDRFWGVCNGQGENWLGKILMEERTKLVDSVEHDIYAEISKNPEFKAYFNDMSDYINHSGGE